MYLIFVKFPSSAGTLLILLLARFKMASLFSFFSDETSILVIKLSFATNVSKVIIL